MEKYKVGYPDVEIEVEALDMTSAIIEAFKIKFPKSLGFAIIVSKVDGEFNPFAISSKYIIKLLGLPFYDVEEKLETKIKRNWLQKIFS